MMSMIDKDRFQLLFCIVNASCFIGMSVRFSVNFPSVLARRASLLNDLFSKLLFYRLFSGSPKKRRGRQTDPFCNRPSFRLSMRYFAKQAESSIAPGQSGGTNVVQ
jgi:hypothetical protein